MKSKQDIQLELLQELDEICSKNDLKYIFVGKNSFNAYINHTIKNNHDNVSVAMTLGDIERFCNIIEKQNYPNRYVEGMFNNPKYLPLYVSYGNENTTDYNMISLNNNIHYGIHIRIYPIMKSVTLDGKKIEVKDSQMMKEDKFRKLLNKQIVNKKYAPIKLGLTILDKAYDVSGFRKKYLDKIFNNIFIDKWEDIQNYSKVQIDKTILSTKHFKELAKYEVDDIELYYPKNIEEYVKEIYGKNIEHIDIVFKAERKNAIIDTEISYKKILNKTKELLDEIRATHEELVWGRSKVKNEKKCVDDIWQLVQMADAQIEYTNFFNENIDYLSSLDLNDESQLKELEIVLNPIVKQLESYANNGMTFSIDDEADSLIRKFLLIKEKRSLIKKMDDLNKLEYFVE